MFRRCGRRHLENVGSGYCAPLEDQHIRRSNRCSPKARGRAITDRIPAGIVADPPFGHWTQHPLASLPNKNRSDDAVGRQYCTTTPIRRDRPAMAPTSVSIERHGSNMLCLCRGMFSARAHGENPTHTPSRGVVMAGGAGGPWCGRHPGARRDTSPAANVRKRRADSEWRWSLWPLPRLPRRPPKLAPMRTGGVVLSCSVLCCAGRPRSVRRLGARTPDQWSKVGPTRALVGPSCVRIGLRPVCPV